MGFYRARTQGGVEIQNLKAFENEEDLAVTYGEDDDQEGDEVVER